MIGGNIRDVGQVFLNSNNICTWILDVFLHIFDNKNFPPK